MNFKDVSELTDHKNENRKTHSQKNTVEKLNKTERQKLVYTMDLQSYQNKEIADTLNVSLSTIEKDLHEIKTDARNWFKEISKSGMAKSLIDAVLQIDFVQKELWQLYRNETKKEIKIKLLDAIVNSSLKKKGLYWTSGQKASWFDLGN